MFLSSMGRLMPPLFAVRRGILPPPLMGVFFVPCLLLFRGAGVFLMTYALCHPAHPGLRASPSGAPNLFTFSAGPVFVSSGFGLRVFLRLHPLVLGSCGFLAAIFFSVAFWEIVIPLGQP